MTDKEIAMQITLKAMDTGFIRPGKPEANHNENVEACNDFSVKEVCDFYKAVLETINQVCKTD